jgi:hypothetical protein
MTELFDEQDRRKKLTPIRKETPPSGGGVRK